MSYAGCCWGADRLAVLMLIERKVSGEKVLEGPMLRHSARTLHFAQTTIRTSPMGSRSITYNASRQKLHGTC